MGRSWSEKAKAKIRKTEGRTKNIKTASTQVYAERKRREKNAALHLRRLEAIHAAHQNKKIAQRDGHPD